MTSSSAASVSCSDPIKMLEPLPDTNQANRGASKVNNLSYYLYATFAPISLKLDN